MAVRVPINGDTLRWARELSHVEADELARSAGVQEAKINEFEQGDSEPTYRQIALIAKKLDRPLAFFMAPVPTEIDVPQAADFRGRTDASLPSALAKEMKRADAHRSAMLDLAGTPNRPVGMGAITWADVEARSEGLRSALGLREEFRPPESQANGVFNFWRGLLEHHGFLVFQTTGVDFEVFRGLSIHHDLLPIILVNGADSANGKVFTLFHEVAHLANRTSGICVLNDTVQEEAICNAFAANVLMPRRVVRAVLGGVEVDERVEALARNFKVSHLAAAVRLVTLRLLDQEGLDEVRRNSDANWRQAREAQTRGTGFPPPWRLKYRDLGSTYIGTVAKAIEDDRVDYLDATYLLNARLPMVEKMLEEYYRTGGVE